MASRPDKSLARSVGEFFGHIWKGVKTPADAKSSAKGEPPATARQVVKHEVQEEHRSTPAGEVTLRRTTIEEIEIRAREN